MAAVEVWLARGRDRVVELEADAYTIGSDPDSSSITVTDPTVSRVHAALERIGAAWLVRDLGSRNGTYVNGQRLTGQRRLRHGEEILIGPIRLRYSDSVDATRPATDALQGPPQHITRTERQVLVELCRPLLGHNAFQEPSSVAEIAVRLHVGRNAIQAHLINLYAKFALHQDAVSNRRVALANEALRRGAVTIADLERTP